MKNTHSNRKGVIVGIFIFLGILIFAIAVLVLGGQRKSFIQSIQIKAHFKDVGGLKKGDNVWYAGVKVGIIHAVTFQPNEIIEVQMNIEKKSVPYITKDVKAKLSTDGLVGNKIVSLSGGNTGAASIEEGDLIQVATTVGTEELMSTLQVNNENLVEITKNLKTLTGQMVSGQGTIGKLLNDSSIFEELRLSMGILRQTMRHAQTVAGDFASFSSKLQQEGSLTHALVNDTMLFSNLQQTASQLQQASTHANSMLANLENLAGSIDSKLNDSKSAAGVLLNDPQTAISLKKTILNLESTTQKLNTNMQALRSNFLFRKYFRKNDQANTPTPAELERAEIQDSINRIP
jgi:phospholipid/cholesterol/gamma-HCH transport system substrate-binding protein